MPSQPSTKLLKHERLANAHKHYNYHDDTAKHISRPVVHYARQEEDKVVPQVI